MSSFALFERIFQYLDMKVDIEEKPDAKPLSPGKVVGEIEFKNVSFSYEPESGVKTLTNINFSAEPGQLVALVGPSGAGKPR